MSDLTENEVSDITRSIENAKQALEKNDYPRFFKNLQIFFAHVPHAVHVPLEKHYQSIFYIALSLIGARVSVEDATNDGRIDAVIELKSNIVIFEFKLNKSAELALKQIEDKRYYQKYLNSPKETVLVGVEFDSETRNIKGWATKSVPQEL